MPYPQGNPWDGGYPSTMHSYQQPYQQPMQPPVRVQPVSGEEEARTVQVEFVHGASVVMPDRVHDRVYIKTFDLSSGCSTLAAYARVGAPAQQGAQPVQPPPPPAWATEESVQALVQRVQQLEQMMQRPQEQTGSRGKKGAAADD